MIGADIQLNLDQWHELFQNISEQTCFAFHLPFDLLADSSMTCIAHDYSIYLNMHSLPDDSHTSCCALGQLGNRWSQKIKTRLVCMLPVKCQMVIFSSTYNFDAGHHNILQSIFRSLDDLSPDFLMRGLTGVEWLESGGHWWWTWEWTNGALS